LISSVRIPPVRSRVAFAAFLMLLPGEGLAGGFGIEQAQSVYFQGMSMAGVAAGGSSISSIFWNPAAGAFAANGATFESSFSLILSEADLTVLSVNGVSPPPEAAKTDISRDALTGASFATWRLNEQTVLGLSITSPWGLGSKPDNPDWAGEPLSSTNKLLTVNVAPSLSYEIMRGLAVGAGVQVEYFDLLKLKAATPLGTSNQTGESLGVGFTAGVNFQPVSGTSIGLGFRSVIRHHVEGDVELAGLAKAPATADIEHPETVTLSLRQALSPAARLFGTAEWTNWSRLGVIPVVLQAPFGPLAAGDTVANHDYQWRDGWYFALGGEYDWSRDLILRAGAAYEITPVDEPTTRPTQVPDSNRWYASIGASYQWSESTSVNVSYHHVFYEADAPFDRTPAATVVPPDRFLGTADLSADVIGIGIKMRLGAP